MDPRCKGMPLSSFILKPMQRVTRYPLIIKNVSAAPFPHAWAPGPRRPACAPLSVGGIRHQQGLEHLHCLSRKEQLLIKELIILHLQLPHQVALTLNVGSES